MRRTFIRKYDHQDEFAGNVIPMILFWRKLSEKEYSLAWWQILYVFKTMEQRDSTWKQLITGICENVGPYSNLYETGNHMEQSWYRSSNGRIFNLDPPNAITDPQIEIWYP